MSNSSIPAISWSRVGFLTLAAAALLAGLHSLPKGPALSHMDFVPGGAEGLQFCDPRNPRFLAVVARLSPVTILLEPAFPTEAGRAVETTLLLRTATGKPVGPGDLLPTARARLHLFVVGPSPADFQHLIPEAGDRPGKWRFAFTPQQGGLYRFFADFTPAATEREMYAAAELPVIGPNPSVEDREWRPVPVTAGATRIALQPSADPIFAHQPIDLRLTVAGIGGASLPMLIAVDDKRTGLFVQQGLPEIATPPREAQATAFIFKLTFPDPGRYCLWAEITLSGHRTVLPFRMTVLP